MNKKTYFIVIGLALIIFFFLPLVSAGSIKVSGYDSLFGNYSKAGKWPKYLYLVMPVTGLLLVMGAATGNYILSRRLLRWLPLIALIAVLIVFPLIDGTSINMIFKKIGNSAGIGLWGMIVASLLLAFYEP